MSIQTLSFNHFSVSFQNNGYLNATSIATQFNKRVGNYLRNERTQEYITALAESLSRTQKSVLNEKQLVIVKNGGIGNGTWLHPKLAVDFARWLDPRFAVWCDEQIEQIISGSLKIAPKTTVDDRTPLRNAVNMLVVKKGLNYSEAYTLIHQRFAVGALDELSQAQLPEAVEYVHRVLMGDVLDKAATPALPSLPTVDDKLMLAIGRLLIHAQDMRLFVNRYLPAFENLGIGKSGALWSYVHDTEPTFKHVRNFFLDHTPSPAQPQWSQDDVQWVRNHVISTM